MLVEWHPELEVHHIEGRQLLVSTDRRLRAWELADKLAEPPGPLASTWGGPDPSAAAPGRMAVPATPRRRPPPT
jgi:hypothetical protein